MIPFPIFSPEVVISGFVVGFVILAVFTVVFAGVTAYLLDKLK